MVAYKAAAVATLFAGAASAAVTNAQTSLRILYQNNLNMTDDANHISAILLDPATQSAAASACAVVGENLLNKLNLMAYKADFLPQLSYIEYAGYTPNAQSQAFRIADNMVVVATQGGSTFMFPDASTYASQSLPVLCTNTQGQALLGSTGQYNSIAATNAITVPAANGNQYTGFRNQKAFRFQGVR